MSAQFVQQLRSSDPAARRAAIIALADSSDPEAINYLARVAQSDPDPSLRKLAAKAHEHAQRKSWRAAGAEEQQHSGSSTWDAHINQANAEINSDRHRARAQLNNAIGSHASGDRKGALTALLTAVDLDSSLRFDRDAMALAGELTGESPDEAIDILLKRVKKKQAREHKPTSPGTLFMYIGLQSLILYFLATGFAYLIVLALASSPPQSSNSPEMARVAAQLSKLSRPELIGRAAVLGIIITVGLLFYFFEMYFLGLIMGGFGTLFDFVNVILRVYMGLILFTIVWCGLILTRVIQFSTSFDTSMALLAIPVVWVVALAIFAARELDFGILRGVMTVFAPQLLGCLITIALSTAGIVQRLINNFAALGSP